MTNDVMAVCGEGEKSWALLSPDGSYHKLKEPRIFVGRQEDVDLILKSRSVCKKHAVISAQPDQGLYYIHDLDSLNGTFVNEKRVHNALLGLSDTVRFGYDMNIFRVDLYPCKENAQISLDENNNNHSRPVREKSHNNSQDTDTKRQPNMQCCKEPHESQSTYKTSEESMAKICQNCSPKAADKGSMDGIVKGSNLYGQPSWWGWGSSDEEIYTYPNSATLITQPQALSAPPHCTVMQRRRNKAHLQRDDFAASDSTRINMADGPTRLLQVNQENPARIQQHMAYPQMDLFTRGGFQDFSTPCYPTFDAWESVPQGGLAERIEGSGVKLNDSMNLLSYHIPIVPEFGELPEKPVNDKSSVTRTTTSETSEKTDQNLSTSSLRSEYGDWNYSSAGTSPDYEGPVFGLTEVNIRHNSAHLAQQLTKEVEDSSGHSSPDSWTSSPKGVEVGKPKNSPVKVKTGPRPSTPRSATEKNRVRRGHTSAANEEKPVNIPRDESRGSSSGGSSGTSDSESRGSGRCPTTPFSSSTDSEGERNDESLNKHKSKTEKQRKKPGSLVLNPGDSPDKTHRPTSSSPGSLPRGNKTAMLRALTSREALKSFGPTSSASRTKNRHRHSTPAARNDLSSSEPSSSASLIWSPRNPSTHKLTSPSGRCRPSRPRSVGSSSASSLSQTLSSSRVSSDFETRAAVDAIFDSCSTGTYALPKDLQMNRNDAKNKTFVLEEKNDRNSSCSTSIETPQDISSNDSSWSSLNDTDDKTLRLSPNSNGEIPKTLSALEDSRLLSRLADPSMNTWMRSQPGKDRCASPDSMLSVAPASSPSPPSTPRSSAKNLREERTNCCSAPPHARRQWDITDKPVEDLMLSSVHAFTVELRLASELVLSKARNLYETDYVENGDLDRGDSFQFTDKKDNQSTMPEWKSSHAEMAGVFRNLRRVEFNIRTMDQALSFLCSTSTKDSREERRQSLPEEQPRQSPRKWKDFKVRARKFSWAEENKNKFPGPPSDEEEVTSP